MKELKKAIRNEIIRLARHELRKQMAPIQASVKRAKTTLVSLKAQLDALQKAREPKATGAAVAVSDEEVKTARFSGALIKKLRMRLGLSRNEFGKLIGVSGFAVIAWETDECKPNAERRKAIIALRKTGKRQVAKLLKEGQTVA